MIMQERTVYTLRRGNPCSKCSYQWG